MTSEGDRLDEQLRRIREAVKWIDRALTASELGTIRDTERFTEEAGRVLLGKEVK